MKRMKSLLALVMAVVMVLALGIPALAVGETITILNPGSHGYAIAKIFTASVPAGSTEVVYTATEKQMKAITGQSPLSLTAFPDLTFVPNGSGGYTVQKSATYSAADFAKWLNDNDDELFGGENRVFDFTKDDNHNSTLVSETGEWTKTADPTDSTLRLTFDIADQPGYWYIKWDNGEPYALTTVLPDGHSDVQNKKDIPFDKEVYRWSKADDGTISDANFDQMNDTTGVYTSVAKPDLHDNTADTAYSWDRESVEVGDKLHYVVTLKVPDVTGNTDAFYEVWDVLSAGQSYAITPNTLKVWVKTSDGNGNYAYTDILPTLGHVTDYSKELGEDQWKDQVSTGANDTEIWRIRFDFIKHVKTNQDYQPDSIIYIEYDAIVTEDVGVIDNTAHSHYRFDKFEEWKDAQTQNYDSQIVIDKYETGNASQKLEGAQFILAQDPNPTINADGSIELSNDAKFYKANNATTPTSVTWEDPVLSNGKIDYTATAATVTVATTLADGTAYFKGLEDGTYYLYEVVAPTGYVRLDQPIKIVVNGEAALDPALVVDNNSELTTAAQISQLTNDARVGNTPGSVLPSTGGRGTTMLYMAGLGMMLAAGAFLIFRRRAEAGK